MKNKQYISRNIIITGLSLMIFLILIFFLQATGVRLGMMLQALSCIAVGLVIGFFFSWKFTLFILGVVPFLMMAAVVQMQLAKGFSGKHNKLLEDAAKARDYCQRFFCMFSDMVLCKSQKNLHCSISLMNADTRHSVIFGRCQKPFLKILKEINIPRKITVLRNFRPC